ncbi:MAG: MFS transporter, partial [Nevskiales bacterium]
MFRAFGSRNYALYWGGACLSNIGSWMQTVALGWLVLQLTDSPFWVGFVSFAALSPSLFMSLFGGVLADRLDRRLLLMTTQTAMMLSTGTLATLTAFHLITVPLIIVLSFLTGFANALNTPAQQAMIADLVPPDILLNAISLNSVQFNLARVVGPACAGIIIGWVNISACFFLNSVSFVALIAALTLIRVAPQRPLPSRTIWRHLGEGIQYVRAQPLLRLVLATAAMLSLFCLPYIVLMPVFARDVLHAGPDGFGYLM